VLDWLPWNHVFGGSHNFNMMLANGGSFYCDEGKPVPALFPVTLRNVREQAGTLAFNVPMGFELLLKAMHDDVELRRAYFAEMDLLFYAGASLPQNIWEGLENYALEVRGSLPLMISSWGLTETAPATLLQHEPTRRSGVVGVPLPGVEAKLIPDADMRCEIRVRGPNIMPGYYADDEKTAEAFDEEGFFITGDAMKFVDRSNDNAGMAFDGRISEDFKLLTGTWVRASTLRLEALKVLGEVAGDVVITGHDRNQIGVLIFPKPEVIAALDEAPLDDDGALVSTALQMRLAELMTVLDEQATGSSTRIARALVLAEPPSVKDSEITAKGNLNNRKVLTRRAELVERLYNDHDSAVVRG
jgi:feruloyl-CoA synthase